MSRSAFLFDMDGTIVDNMDFHTQSWEVFFSRRGIAIDKEDFFRCTAGRQGKEIMRTYIGEDLSDEECAALDHEKEAIYRELYAPHRKLANGFLDFVQSAREAGIRMAVATAAPDENVRFILDALGVRDYFDTVVGARDVARGKPHPDVFLKAADICGVAPASCIVFEDAPLGVEAASRAGMAAVVLITSMGESGFRQFGNIIGTGRDFSLFDPRGLRGIVQEGKDHSKHA